MAAFDLCTVADVRALMQTPVGDTEQDAIIQSLVSCASRAIARFCEHEFAPPTTSAARTFEYEPGSMFLNLAPYSLRSVTQVRVDTDLTPTTLDPSFYRLYPQPNPLGVFTSLRMYPFAPAGWQKFRRRLVEVTGAWGFASVPEDVALACQIAVVTWVRRDVSAFSTVYNLDTQQYEVPDNLPAASRGLLTVGGFKREVYA